jgi:transposase
MAKTFTVADFFQRFPDDDSCLNHLMRLRFGDKLACPKCQREGNFKRIRSIPAYGCAWCGHHVHPTVGTPFTKSRTPLQKWFYAMYLFTTSRHGVPAKELQRQLGLTYKAAWRMGHEIRKYMAEVDGDGPLSGHVEADESYVGGVHPRNQGRSTFNKTIVFGMFQREGNIMTRVVQNVGKPTLLKHIKANIKPGSRISTDEFRSYETLPKLGYDHRTVNHVRKQWASGETHTNGLEGFWSLLKRAIRGTHVHVSAKHMSKYLGEFEYRYNMRKDGDLMFPRLVLSF